MKTDSKRKAHDDNIARDIKKNGSVSASPESVEERQEEQPTSQLKASDNANSETRDVASDPERGSQPLPVVKFGHNFSLLRHSVVGLGYALPSLGSPSRGSPLLTLQPYRSETRSHLDLVQKQRASRYHWIHGLMGALRGAPRRWIDTVFERLKSRVNTLLECLKSRMRMPVALWRRIVGRFLVYLKKDPEAEREPLLPRHNSLHHHQGVNSNLVNGMADLVQPEMTQNDLIEIIISPSRNEEPMDMDGEYSAQDVSLHCSGLITVGSKTVCEPPNLPTICDSPCYPSSSAHSSKDLIAFTDVDLQFGAESQVAAVPVHSMLDLVTDMIAVTQPALVPLPQMATEEAATLKQDTNLMSQEAPSEEDTLERTSTTVVMNGNKDVARDGELSPVPQQAPLETGTLEQTTSTVIADGKKIKKKKNRPQKELTKLNKKAQRQKADKGLRTNGLNDYKNHGNRNSHRYKRTMTNQGTEMLEQELSDTDTL
ncbi:hypothetical protein BGZ94_007309 [Podila epigama]|nr:hypothetical protein BGZ94_007309 [Podila epigama]